MTFIVSSFSSSFYAWSGRLAVHAGGGLFWTRGPQGFFWRVLSLSNLAFLFFRGWRSFFLLLGHRLRQSFLLPSFPHLGFPLRLGRRGLLPVSFSLFPRVFFFSVAASHSRLATDVPSLIALSPRPFDPPASFDT